MLILVVFYIGNEECKFYNILIFLNTVLHISDLSNDIYRIGINIRCVLTINDHSMDELGGGNF